MRRKIGRPHTGGPRLLLSERTALQIFLIYSLVIQRHFCYRFISAGAHKSGRNSGRPMNTMPARRRTNPFVCLHPQRSLSGSCHRHASRSPAAAHAEPNRGRFRQKAVGPDPQLGGGGHRHRLMHMGASIRPFLAVLRQQPKSFGSLASQRSSARASLSSRRFRPRR